MIPLGYMLVEVKAKPDWIDSDVVEQVYSACGCCVSPFFMDYIPLWKHNGWWLFDNPVVLKQIASENGCDLSKLKLFYYEAFEQEFVEEAGWRAIAPEASLETSVKVPSHKTLQGYDVVTFTVQTSPESSPLSCCNLAEDFPVNRFCLLDSFEMAHEAAERFAEIDCEPGPYRIFAVYELDEERG
ncbi:MAG TPA: hypothetical protein VHL34_11950 [Rhizomicrobium sp.]|jgi:hypothetical protein|nr:hypothetical protein [Rhizomicrobium sp.]